MKRIVFFVFIIFIAASSSFAVKSKIVKQKTIEDFSKGKTDNTIISSRGTITLAWATETLAQDFNSVWTINSIVHKNDGTIFMGTSPNGRIYEYKNGKNTCIYPVEKQQKEEPNKPKSSARTHLTNEHVFKLALDSDGDLLAAISGDKCRLVRYDGKKFETLFEPNEASYILALAIDKNGGIFLGTGPKGQIWKLDNKGRNPQLVYSCQDKNILCLAFGKGGSLFAGTDTRGLIYKINPEKKTASILYDSGENEITDLLFDDSGNLYAAATSYKSINAQLKGQQEARKPIRLSMPEEPKESSDEEMSETKQSTSLKIANTPQEGAAAEQKMPQELERGKPAGTESHIYKIDPNGFVTDIFSRNAVFFALYMQKDSILLGTGNKASLFSVNPKTETEIMVYEDKLASQITDIKKSDNDIIFSTANPAKLIKLKSVFAQTGDFQSSLIDAGQPAQWGKLQIEADIPDNSKILFSARSGNVEDVNDPTFSPWSPAVKVTGPVDIAVPLARFLQYKLILNGSENSAPVIRQVAASYVIPNLAPKVMEITIDRKTPAGMRKISFKTEDENEDRLIYRIDFRLKSRKLWIKLIDDLEKPSYDWDTKTVEDGIYEIKVTASDRLSNNSDAALEGSRVSQPVTVDNTPPVVQKSELNITDRKAVLNLKAVDELSAISTFAYTLDSNEDWIDVLPDDGVFDTTSENYTIKTKELKPGQHIIAVKISDAEDNAMYKTFDVEIK